MSQQFKIKNITAREILDSRGKPTVEARVLLASGVVGVASVPSGASTGEHEALELRDGGKRYGGFGVLKALRNIEKIIGPRLRGKNIFDQLQIDELLTKLDGTKNKKKLGANAMLAVSLAVARAGANAAKMPLYRYLRRALEIKTAGYRMPVPMFNIINGGVHAANGLDIQEFMVVPMRAPRFKERVRIGAEIFYALGNIFKKEARPAGYGDEGGYAPVLKKNESALQYIVAAIKNAGFASGADVGIALDVAASEFFDKTKNVYNLSLEGKKLSGDALVKMYGEWVKKYPVVSIEDPINENDWAGWVVATKNLKGTMVVGDDLFVTNEERLMEGIKSGAANSIIIKYNQAGTLSAAAAAAKLAKSHGYKLVVSHRSGETTDDFVADFAVALNAEFVKFGATSRGERVAKYNRLMEIESEII